jgi:hypothetical protein
LSEETLRSFHEKQALLYARKYLSPYIYVSDIDERSKEARLGLVIQDGIVDHRTEDFRTRTVNLSDIGSLRWRRSQRGKILFQGPSRTQFVKRTRDLYSAIIQRSQQLLLSSLYTRLVTIPTVMVAMSPFKKILISLEESEHRMVSVREVGRRFSGERAHRYFAVLKDLQYIEKVDDRKYTVGKAMSNLKADRLESTELYRMILADVIQRRAKYLQEVLHLTMIVPFLRWSNSYYFPSYEAGRLVKMHNEELLANCRRYYGVRTEVDSAKNQIQSVIESQILTRDSSDYIEGNERTFNEYASNADRQDILEPIPGGISTISR